MSKRIISLLVAFVICISIVPVCYADSDGAYISKTSSYFDRMLHGIVNGTSGVFLLSSGIQGIASFLNSDICALSSDGYHYADSFFSDRVGEGKDGAKYAEAICKFCGEVFLCYASDLSAAYDDYVQTLPASGYSSNGGLRWSPSHGFSRVGYLSGTTYHVYCEHDSGEASGTVPGRFSYNFDCSNNFIRIMPLSGSRTFGYRDSMIAFEGSAPIDGYYSIVAGTPSVSGYYVDSDGVRHSVNGNWAASTLSTYYASGGSVSIFLRPGYSGILEIPSGVSCQLVAYQGIPPVYEITPVSSFSGDTYNITTRPTSISGGNYGIIGDNGQITKVENNSTIINETNNTFYNPATGTTVPIVNWSYDYSDRSYKVTLESGDTATITYGDENITISQITTTEGDTITNNYTIYYLIDGSGTPPCEHDWQEGEATIPTCTRPGSASYVCSKCQQTKTEALPALGHNWQVKQTVTTQYDDTGQLIQEGYTIFECSLCHEQYKSTDGTIPPGGGSGTDPGGEEEGGGFLSWLFGKLGELLGTIGNGILNLLQTALDKIFSGLLDLINSLFENLAKLVDLFGSVGEAFQVLWTWLPPEIIAILVAGVSIFVFVALLKFFMK